MILNTTAAIIMCMELGISIDSIKNSLSTFHNALRRFQIEEVGTTTIIDDYAHHPTEIKVTLEGVRQKYPDREIVVVFKPNTYSRTKDFTDEFASALGIADKVFLTEIDCNRESQSDYPGVSSSLITEKIDGAEIIDENNPEVLENYSRDVICFMSCASISHLIDKVKEIVK